MPDGATFVVLDSPHGPIHAAATDAGICALSFRTTTDRFVAELARRVPGPVESATARATARGRQRAHLQRLSSELDAYWAGRRRSVDVQIDLRVRSDWDRRVLGAVRTIDYGETLSYGQVAARAGSPGAARAVGGAVGRNPIGLLVPCHRVIAGDGSLGGYGGSWFGDREELLALKRALLAGEGVRIG